MKKIVIVPSWIERSLNREKRSINDVLSYSKLMEVFSPKDICALLSFQSHPAMELYHIGGKDSTALVEAWKRNSPEFNFKEFESLVKSFPNNITKDYENLLIAGENREETQAKSFSVVSIDHYTLLLILKDGCFSSADYEEQDANIVENILRVLYGEFVQEEVAQTPLFKRYVVNLSKRIT